MIKLKDLLSENATKPLTVYHGTGKSFRRFNLDKTTQGIIWFTSNKNNILSGDVGAESSGYVLTCEVTIHKPAGWKEYDKYMLAQLSSMGYDGAILTESDGFDCFVFDPSQVKILKSEKVSNLVREGDGEDYRGSHTAPDKTNGTPLHDLTGVYPDDIYSDKAVRYYGDMGGDANDMVSVRLMQSYRNKPNAMVKIYRAVPDTNKEVDDRIKYYNHLNEEHKLSASVEKLENDIKTRYPTLDKLGIYMDGRKNSLFLSDLYVKKEFRGTGVGSAVMREIVTFADNNHIPIVLIPEPEGRLSVKKLILFYSKFGFVVNRGKNVDYFLSEPFVLSMYRVPR